MERPPAPPEAVIIRLAREAAGIPVAAAAKGAGVSIARWSQIENGSEIRHGSVSPVTGRAGTIARMAAEVGVSPERLESEGRRPDAAEILREILRPEPARPAQPAAFPLPAPTPAMARQLAPFLAEVEIRVKVAQDAYPGQRLSGRQVFPDSEEGATYWDWLVEAGFPPEQLGPITAVMLARSAEQAELARRQGGHAAGLTRYRAIRHIGSATAMTRA